MRRLAASLVWAWLAALPGVSVAQQGLPEGAGPWLKTAWLVGLDAQSPRGAMLRAPDGRVTPARGSLAELLALSEDPLAGRVELAWPLEAQLSEGVKAVGLTPLVKDRETLGHAGDGVLVGLIDTGIDWSHPDFSGESGPRIAWLLDLSLAERVGAHPGVDAHGGALWSREEIARALAGELEIVSRDTVGHGTHVAGIVGGRAGASGATLADGVAPEVDLIVVKASRAESVLLDEADVMEAILFVLERAEELGRPVVINLSLGGHSGPHDGSTDFERHLSELFEGIPGRALVAAAGNDGGRDIHASGQLGDEVTIPLTIPETTRDHVEPGYTVVDLWYEANSPVEVELISPDGRTTGRVSPGDSGQDIDGRRGSLSVTHALPDEAHPGLQEALILIQEPVSGALDPENYQIVLHGGEGRFDAWVALRGPFEARLAGSLDADTRLTVPGTLASALSVGAYNTRAGWLDREGNPVELDLPLGAPSFFSGTGPTLDGRPKPDVLAPGTVVVSALSADADPRLNPGSIFAGAVAAGVDPVTPGGRHAATQGTSMSTAFASGAAALLLEQDPTRTSAQIADLLRATASAPALGPATLWDPRAGFGLIHVERALWLGADHHGTALSPSRSSAGVSRDLVPLGGEGRFEVLVVARDAEGLPLRPGWVPALDIRAETGQVLIGDPVSYGAHTLSIPVARSTARGRATVRVTIGGVPLDDTPTLHFAATRGDITPPAGRVAGGACSAPRAAGGTTPGSLDLLALWGFGASGRLGWVAAGGTRARLGDRPWRAQRSDRGLRPDPGAP